MGDIGPSRAHYDVLPVPQFGLDDADTWTAEPQRPAEPGETPGQAAEAVARDDPGR